MDTQHDIPEWEGRKNLRDAYYKFTETRAKTHPTPTYDALIIEFKAKEEELTSG